MVAGFKHAYLSCTNVKITTSIFLFLALELKFKKFCANTALSHNFNKDIC